MYDNVDGGVIPCSICGKFTSVSTPCNCWGKSEKHTIGKSQIDCEECGEIHNIFTGCRIKPDPAKYPGLEKLYAELGKLEWIGEDVGWDKAISAVRAEIRRMLK